MNKALLSTLLPVSATILAVVCFVFLFGGKAYGTGNDLRKIVVFDHAPTVAETSRIAGAVDQAGGSVVKMLPLVNGMAVRVPDEAVVHALVRIPGVLRVDDDIRVEAVRATAARARGGGRPSTDPPQVLPWGVDRIDADLAWNGGAVTGAGVKVAVVDTGIDLDHPDLKGNIKGGYNALNPRRRADDDNGHGTHVAGIIAAADNAIGVVGVAPDASLYAVKVLDSNGSGYISDVIDGLDWAVRNGIQVINLSLGTSVDNQTFHDAIAGTYNAGVTIVAAAGNMGPTYDSVLYPAKYPETIAVSASDQTDNQPSWSSWGPEVDLAAPGNSLSSTYLGGGYTTLSGTSMAAPHVAGTAALVLAQWGAVTPATMQIHLIRLGAESATLDYPLTDAQAAVNSLPRP